MNDAQEVPEPVIRLSLLAAPERFDDDQLLATAVEALLAPYGLTAPRTYRFLVLDSPEGMVRNQSVYERLLRYQRAPRISLLCLLVGDLLPDPDRSGESPVLLRPGLLRASSVGLLWAGDVKSAGHRGAAPGTVPDPQALGALADLLLSSELFDRVLQRLDTSCNGVAAPGLRLLEYDLSATARDRAWANGAARFVGQPPQRAATLAGSGRTGAPQVLPQPLGLLAEGSGAGPAAEYAVDGTLGDRRSGCVEALRTAGRARKGLAGMRGLTAGHDAEDFSRALVEARSAVAGYRAQVVEVLELGGHLLGAIDPSDAGLRLKELGLVLPPPGITAEQMGEGLSRLAERLFDEGLTLGAAADRFEDCSARMMPYQDETLVRQPDLVCPPSLLEPGGGGIPPSRRSRAGTRVLTLLAGALAGFGVWPWVSGTVVLLLFTLVGAVLTPRRLPDSAPEVRATFRGGYVWAQGLSVLLGGAAAAVLGSTLRPPGWSEPIGLFFGLVLAWVAVTRDWNRGVEQIWKDSGAAALQGSVRALDEVLDRAVRQRWWAESVRIACAEAARSVSVVFGTVAATLTAEAAAGVRDEAPMTAFAANDRSAGSGHTAPDPEYVRDVPAWMPRTGPAGSGRPSGVRPTPGPSAAQGRPPTWLDQQNGEGGPDLVATLGGDFADLVVQALEPYWEAVKRGQAVPGSEKQVARKVRELLVVARRHLLHNGVIPAPPFAEPKRARSGPAGLLGLGLDQVVDAAGPHADRERVVQLVSSRQLPMLSRDPSAVVWIRFAPAAVRSQLDGQGNDRDGVDDDAAVWTSSGRYAGQLRLTPLRQGSVERLTTYGGTEDGRGARTDRTAGPRHASGAVAPVAEQERAYSWNDPSDEEHSW